MAENNGDNHSTQIKSRHVVKTLGQFIRDMSFENFSAQRKDWNPVDLRYELKLELNINNLKDNKYLVSTKVILEAQGGKKSVYLLELDYCGLFLIENMPESQIKPCLAVHCPNLMYPYLRKIVSGITQDSGFLPYNMEIINFAAIYEQEMVRLGTSEGSKSLN